MSRLQDRTWYVLPAARRMVWKTYETEIAVEVMAFSFDGDRMVYVTVHGTVIEAVEMTVA